MKNLLPFRSPGADEETLAPARDRVLGHRVTALRQTPWMTPVCVQNAGAIPYTCRILLLLESGHALRLDRESLHEEPADGPLEGLRLEEHRRHAEGSPVDHTVVAAGVDGDGVVHLVLEDGGLLWIAERPGGPLAYDRVDPADPGRLRELRDLWTGAPLVASE